MTREQVLSLDHLATAEVTKFLHIHSEEGWIITSWKEDGDIKEYSGSVCYYMPIRDEYEDYRVITEEDHKELEAQREKALKEEANKKNE